MYALFQSLDEIEPLLVTRQQARRLLGYGETKLDELIKQGVLESFVEGRARRITMRSIHDYVKRQLEQAKAA
jgi:hypothetical protein